MKQSAPTAIDKIIGENIRKRRTEKLMDQRMLAARIGDTYQHVRAFENGTLSLCAGRLYRISRALGIDVDRLFDPPR